MFISYSETTVTFSTLAWLYPLGPSNFVRLNFKVLVHRAVARQHLLFFWHFVALRSEIRSLNLTDSRVIFFLEHHQSYYHYYNYYYCSSYYGIICRIVVNHTTCKNTPKSFEFKYITNKSVWYPIPVLDRYNLNFISDGRTLKWMPVKNVVWVLFCQHEINPKSSQQQMTACPHHMFSSEGFILMHLPSLPVLWPQIRIIRCIQTPGTLTHTCTHTLARFMFPSLSCLYHSQLAASGQLCSPERHKNSEGEKRKKSPSTLINQTWASSGPQLAFPCRPPHSPPFAFPLTQSVTAPSDSSRWADESYANVPCL